MVATETKRSEASLQVVWHLGDIAITGDLSKLYSWNELLNVVGKNDFIVFQMIYKIATIACFTEPTGVTLIYVGKVKWLNYQTVFPYFQEFFFGVKGSTYVRKKHEMGSSGRVRKEFEHR